jgi:hypothetical protein
MDIKITVQGKGGRSPDSRLALIVGSGRFDMVTFAESAPPPWQCTRRPFSACRA